VKRILSKRLIYVLLAFIALGVIISATLTISAGTITGTLNASEFEEGDIVSDTSSGIFLIKATAEKYVTIQANSKTDEEGNKFTNRLKLNGVGDSDSRSVHFNVDSAAYVRVYVLSGSSSQDRNLALYNSSTGEVVDSKVVYGGATTGISDNIIPVLTYTIEEAGSFYLVAEVGAVNIYQVEVEELGELAPRKEWSEVESPVLEEVSINETDGTKVDVPWTMDIGRDGADKLVFNLLDESGEVVKSNTVTTLATSGIESIEPPTSGNYTIQAEAFRDDEETTKTSNTVEVEDFVMPLDSPVITKIKTGSDSSAVVRWKPVSEAESYTLEYKATNEDEYIVAHENIKVGDVSWLITSTITGLTAGTEYDIKVSAIRGIQKQSTTETFTIASEEEEWTWDNIGSGGKGTVTENDDGSLTIDATGGKIADSEDGFTFYYTEINPESENFTLTAKFRVDDSENKDNQSGFGVIATDTLVENDSSYRYFNSAAALFAKFYDSDSGNLKYGIPGGRFVTGYTGSPNESSSDRNLINNTPFDWDFKYDYVTDDNPNPPKFEDGEEYTLTLRKSNTGYETYMDDDTSNRVIYYGTDLLNVQEEDKVYVGMCVSRKIKCTVLDYSFTKIAPEDDDPEEERPIEYTTPKIELDTTTTTSSKDYTGYLVPNVKGTYTVYNKKGKVVVEDVLVEANERSQIDLSLKKGANDYTVEFTPASHDEQGFEDYEDLDSYEPFEYDFTVTYKTYRKNESTIYVSPNGSSKNSGSKKKPLDIYTATSYVKPGQKIILLGGEYNLDEQILIARGNNGTEEDKIILMSDPDEKAVLNFENSETGGVLLKGDYWHIYNIDITNSINNLKALHVTGNNNIIEKCNFYNNTSTGMQISGYSSEDTSMWPTNNLVISCEAYNNCDTLGNDADGFGAKLTCGEGNVFRYCIAHHNIDDGWDLYAKSTSGSIGVVTIESCVAYANGKLTEDTGNTLTGEGNGFKLGGESMPGAHILTNSISFNNLGKGITSNSGPDCQVTNCISYKNTAENLSLYTSYKVTDYVLDNVISYSGGMDDEIKLKNQTSLESETNYINGVNVSGVAVEDNWFESLDVTIEPTIASDGSIDMHGLLVLTDEAPEDTGAVIEENENPTEIDVDEDNIPEDCGFFESIFRRIWNFFFK
jgi:hypothetical protein